MVPRPQRALILRAGAVLLALAVACSCASMSASTARKKETSLLSDLIEVAREFNARLAWGDYAYCSGFIAPEKKEDFALALDKVADRVRIEEAQLITTRLLPVEETTQPKDADPKDPVREGLVTVKLVNLTVAPSSQVVTRALVEKWIYRDGKWLTTMSLLDLLK